ncbi:unnamed protein product [Soboliphyme baturini]|uniref:Peptidase M12B domain-containing protein n=1 Tax=Soboliphyme baturini TaxID=241478 RepID=A0A183IQH8_9BILA|nr:unnamed protein product [Soboliphyme baturini]
MAIRRLNFAAQLEEVSAYPYLCLRWYDGNTVRSTVVDRPTPILLPSLRSGKAFVRYNMRSTNCDDHRTRRGCQGCVLTIRYGSLNASALKLRSVHEVPVFSSKQQMSSEPPDYYSSYIKWDRLYIELVIVFDTSMFYHPLNINVALTDVIVWRNHDGVEMNRDGERTLSEFAHYRTVNLVKSVPNDVAVLIT